MHRILSLVVSVGLLLAPSVVRAQKEQSIQFVKKGFAVGDTDTTDMHVELKMNFVVHGPEMEPETMNMSSATKEHFTYTVLSVSKGGIDRLKVAFGDAYEEATEEDQTGRKDSPVSGKTYVAALEKGKVVVTDEAGKAVSKEEQDGVKERIPKLGKADPVEAALPDKPIRVGESLDRFAKVLTKEVLEQENQPEMRFTGTKVKLADVTKDARGTVGTFRVTSTMTIKDPESPHVMTVPFEGTMTLLAEGVRMDDFSLAGPVKLTLKPELRKRGLTIEGDGSMKMSVSSPKQK
ncbi:hypothetical protein JY651_35010 [Pyxidicoccus parkwayensis]|uniref:Uncharacterized protein n=1 Tax=Pyxidicoccus parkwayensis TaxID=2813578 RepID=A0ABX7NNJ7_9BACT|nr:hypothetical protein [Pyxidicoccus parkwaysis]QSQ20430.1 hypothetical protein JY651_35010 [Pyxidicoccus parkwaysis]